MTVMYGDYGMLTSSAHFSVGQDADAILVKSLSEEGLIGQGMINGFIKFNKFGHNTDVDGAEDIWDGGGTYTGFPLSTLETLEALSSSASDASAGVGARKVIVYGLDSLWAFIQDTITLNGVTPVASTLKFRRVYRAKVYTAGTSENNVGTITIRHSTTEANVFAVMTATTGQTNISNFTIPAGYKGYIIKYKSAILDNTSNSANIVIWTREFGEAVRLLNPFHVSTSSNVGQIEVYGGIPLTEKTDVKFRVTSVQNANADITCSYDIIIVKQ